MKKVKEPKPLSWTPRRKGEIYCAPACGMGCTHAAYKDAHQRANKLKLFLEKEVGGIWKVRVWENLGWHCEVHQGTISISTKSYVLGADSYLLMNSDNHVVGCGHGELTVHHPKTQKQVVKAIKASLNEQSRKGLSWLASYNSNSKMKGWKSLIT